MARSAYRIDSGLKWSFGTWEILSCTNASDLSATKKRLWVQFGPQNHHSARSTTVRSQTFTAKSQPSPICFPIFPIFPIVPYIFHSIYLDILRINEFPKHFPFAFSPRPGQRSQGAMLAQSLPGTPLAAAAAAAPVLRPCKSLPEGPPVEPRAPQGPQGPQVQRMPAETWRVSGCQWQGYYPHNVRPPR